MQGTHQELEQLAKKVADAMPDFNSAGQRIAVRAGVDWLEAGTPLVLAEGLHSVRALREEFPTHLIVADLNFPP